MTLDSRIPVLFMALGDARPGDAVLVAGDVTVPSSVVAARVAPATGWHRLGCNCCVPRTAAMQAMAALYLRRARGEVAMFTRLLVAVDPAMADEIRAGLREDRFVSGRYRLAAAAVSKTSPDMAAEPARRAPSSG